MKTFARVAALVLFASSAISGTSFAQSMLAPSASVASGPDRSQPGGPDQSPVPVCPPNDSSACNFFPSGK